MKTMNPALGQYRNSEFIRYMKNVVIICIENDPRELKIEAQVNGLEASIDPLDTLFMIERGNLLTDELMALDDRRDAAISGLRLAATAFAYHFEEPIQKAARLLAATMNKYGNGLARLNYVAETEVIVGIVSDVASNLTLSDAVERLNLTNWMTELETANQLFNQKYLARTNDYAAKPIGSLTELRSDTTQAYSNLTAHLVAHATLTPLPAYTKLIAALDSLTEQYNRLVNSRSAAGALEATLSTEPAGNNGAEL